MRVYGPLLEISNVSNASHRVVPGLSGQTPSPHVGSQNRPVLPELQ